LGIPIFILYMLLKLNLNNSELIIFPSHRLLVSHQASPLRTKTVNLDLP
jgi:hypothetical protein